ncbi:hypothetical protein IIA16_06770, partial [bacterium]|nr:hypothetical protein [bacterium]
LPALGAFRDVHRFLLGTLFFLCLAWAKWLGHGLPRLRPRQAGAAFVAMVALLGAALGPAILSPGAAASLVGLAAALAAAVCLRGPKLALALLALLLLEMGGGLPARWHARFFPYRPGVEISAVAEDDCPAGGVWFLDTYREGLKQESMDAGAPLAAYLGSPNGYLWDDPLFANCPRVGRHQVNSPLRSRWQTALDDQFIPAFGLEGYTVSDLMHLSEVWAPSPLPGAPMPEAVTVAGREWWRHRRPPTTKTYAHYTGPTTMAWVVDEEDEAEGLAALAWVLTGDIWPRLPLTAAAVAPDVVPMAAWWSPGWSGGRVAYAFVARGDTYRLPGLPWNWLSAAAALPLLFWALRRRGRGVYSNQD